MQIRIGRPPRLARHVPQQNRALSRGSRLCSSVSSSSVKRAPYLYTFLKSGNRGRRRSGGNGHGQTGHDGRRQECIQPRVLLLWPSMWHVCGEYGRSALAASSHRRLYAFSTCCRVTCTRIQLSKTFTLATVRRSQGGPSRQYPRSCLDLD